MAGLRVSADRTWFDQQCAGAPDQLRERTTRYFIQAGDAGVLPRRLADSARAALAAALAHPGDRSVALDLLAADALVTLALKAQASSAPEDLDRFAGELLRD